MADEAPQRRGPGRRSKGDRKLIGFRLPTDQAEAVSEVAAAEGYRYVSDWVASVVEDRLNRTDLSRTGHGEEHPVSRIA